MKDFNKKLIFLIRYLPFMFIVIGAIILALFVNNQSHQHLKEDQEFIKKTYIVEEKKRIESIVKRIENYLIDLEKHGITILEENLKESVNRAYSIVENIYNENKDTKTNEQIIILVKTALQNIRFNDGRGYYFIYNMQGTNIFHPIKPQIENTNTINAKDAKGRRYQKDRIELLKKHDEIYFQYSFNKPNDKINEYEKLSFLKRFKPLDWFIGSGEYLDDFENSLKNEALEFIQKLSYKDGGYVFVIKDKIVIANKYKELIGLDVSKSENLEPFYKQYQKVRFSDEGSFATYELLTDDEKNNVKNKVSYMKSFLKWDWVIGTGFDFDHLNEVINTQQETIEEQFNQYLKNLLLLSTFIVLILLLISYVLSKYIQKILEKYQENIEMKNKELLKAQEVAKMANWEIDINTKKTNYSKDIYKILNLDSTEQNADEFILKRILSKEDWSCFENSINNINTKEQNFDCVFKIEKENTLPIWIDCKGEYDTHSNKIIGTLQDITKIKRIELEKQEKEKMLYQQNKMAAMGEMLANIAHQWKQPLSTISTAASGIQLQKEYNNLTDEGFNLAIESINESTEYLSTTIDDFKDFFKPQKNKITKFEISKSIDKAIKLVQARYDSSGIEIVKEIEDMEIISMQNELVQVILNLLNNARDALLESQNKKRYVFINCFKDIGQPIIEVYDNANGIKEDIIERIFEPYFSTKDEDKGTGIGLYMSNEIISKLLKSTLEVENYNFTYQNEKFRGVKFTIKLNT